MSGENDFHLFGIIHRGGVEYSGQLSGNKNEDPIIGWGKSGARGNSVINFLYKFSV